MTELLFALMIATASIYAQPVTPPDRFVEGMHRRGEAVYREDFIGMEWRCLRPYQDETCFAGFDLIEREPVTGP